MSQSASRGWGCAQWWRKTFESDDSLLLKINSLEAKAVMHARVLHIQGNSSSTVCVSVSTVCEWEWEKIQREREFKREEKKRTWRVRRTRIWEWVLLMTVDVQLDSEQNLDTACHTWHPLCHCTTPIPLQHISSTQLCSRHKKVKNSQNPKSRCLWTA